MDKTFTKAEHYLNDGENKADTHDYQGALNAFTKAIEVDTNYVEAYYRRATIKSKCFKSYEAAVEDLNKVIELNKNYIWAYYGRGFAQYKLNRYQEAIADYNKALTIPIENLTGDFDSDAYAYCFFARGLSHSALKDHKKAIEDFEKSIHNKYHRDEEARYNIAREYFEIKNYTEAKRHAELAKSAFLETSDFEGYNKATELIETVKALPN